ncbi:HEPN domain-containing protein [Magnetospirillum sulfuroxidans]|uniref:HEPN domain-containing protein n=1 Tax=Magnetospirillum sulfuroxidans TaxID=611300 RepID=A0ABS5IAE1_9PROT|nr:HEPN domain-containing protein [Magnetospirillum sulfuroxidans]MBR9971299.1 HEPN domain-containing protein [Magnetospirillum sulfuroxidans]
MMPKADGPYRIHRRSKSRRLWSLLDMFKINAVRYVLLGRQMLDARFIYHLSMFHQNGLLKRLFSSKKSLNETGVSALRNEMETLLSFCDELSLPVSTAIISRKLDEPPATEPELTMLVDMVLEEMDSQLFLTVPAHRAPYYDCEDIVSDDVINAFPQAYEEIKSSGTCFAAAQYTAAVFHAMRAVEIGVRTLIVALDIPCRGPRSIDLLGWQDMINMLSSKIRDIENLPSKTKNRDYDLLFYSELSAQFRFFKNGWRVRVAHGRATYDERQAEEVIDHVRSFFEMLATRLNEEAL